MNFNYKRWLLIDILFLFCSIVPSVGAFVFDYSYSTYDFFNRSGAIMVLFAAFLEFRTHEIRSFKEKDHIHAVWRTIGYLIETIIKVDSLSKWSARQLAFTIESAGMQPDIGKAEDLKNIVATEKIKSLKHLPMVPDKFYRYNKIVSIIGKILVILGTIIWAFGDLVLKHI